MMKVRVKLTPMGHYFLGGERGFGYDNNLKRQLSDRYFISSLKVPSQTTLFGALRYILGVKDEKLRDNADDLIGNSSFDIAGKNNDFGMIGGISPLYLLKEHDSKTEYFIRTPFDHKIGKGIYTPLNIDQNNDIEVIHYPGNITKKSYPTDFIAKDGISKSYISLEDRGIIEENDIFKSSVEVVSKKDKSKESSKGSFAKKEYMRLKEGWSFAFFADLNTEKIPDYNVSVILGKDSSAFAVEITRKEEPNIAILFENRGSEFYYCQSPVYISEKVRVNEVIDNCSFSIIESETVRQFETKNSRLQPVYNKALIQLICAGSVFFTSDIKKLINDHAAMAGFNKIIQGGIKQ